MSTIRNGDPMTRTQLMKFNPLWNDSDRAALVEDLEMFGGVEFVFAQTGWNRSVRVLDADGTDLMAVAPARSTMRLGAHGRAACPPSLTAGTCSGRRVGARAAAGGAT